MDQTGLHVFSACAPVKAYTKPYHQRRTHKKSRGGCIKCKEKRVRCDEKHPACTRCARRSLDCQYQRSPGSEKSASASPPHVKLQEPCEEEPLPMLSYEHDLALQLGHPAKILTRSSTRDQLLRHYEVITEHGLVMGPEPKKYHDRVMRMAVDHSYLAHTLLSISALHLTRCKIDGYSQSKLLHLSSALEDFQHAISQPISLDDSDALILTALMISIQYFASWDDSPPEESWVFSTDPQRLSWFSVQQGQSAILAQVRPNHCRSGFLSNFTVQAKDLHGRNRRLPQELFDICEVTDPRGPRGVHPNPYHDIVHALALLMPLEPGINSLMKYMHFCARVHARFVGLVEKNEHRALLILAYWFALLCNVGDVWWCQQRAWRDCTAICMFLDLHGSDEIRQLLDFPAEACGYMLPDRSKICSELDHLGD
ncbi:Sterol uptake control protein 2 [Pseudocercospora fuligena]|uniref:Sterol uptake control protein 2 n=1 Tax=Pseudocercospora fuligena TaxID=685502 RepID=A0A8H6RQQ5_9PEZI|nr:Sterol uptake control protein 2 [Pseudocercospora fuligena]